MNLSNVNRSVNHSIRPVFAGMVAALIMGGSAQAADFSLNYLGQQIVPSGTSAFSTTVGGLSGLDYDATNQRFFAISDDRSQFNPARFYTLNLDLNQFTRSATPGMAGVAFTGVTTIQQPAGGAFAINTVDPEGMRYSSANGKLYWSNEGQRSSSGFQNPSVREMNLDGSHVRDFAVPAYYNPVGSNNGLAAGDAGIYNNLAFESMTISTDGNTLYTATENGLSQDSLPSTIANGSRARILSFDLATGAAGAEYAYDVEPVAIAPNPANQFATNGLTDLLAIGDREFIAIERSFAVGAVTPGAPVTGNTIRLFHVDARNATNIAGVVDLTGEIVTPAAKTLLLDLSTLTNDDGTPLALDNIEGLTLGPVVNGKQTLILVSDNNFGATQFTQFVALEIAPVPEPETWAMLLAGLGLVGFAARRRR
ncbi:esterase-like activity of phytase family protein [Thiobacillus sp.]|uniref:esterase-like activity of phytase family protein n=1 Tax=Thiobacillus sp. TaxID=924 RepID=UPI0025EBB65A|nr:esterase-like activity of phytase family protein [Thiobacillus sp.]MBT9538291.1 esterase-like activity of phytase family protein [Thiobacillus sp.]